MKKAITIFCLAFMSFCMLNAQSGYDIMKRASSIDIGSSSKYTIELSLFAKNGSEKKRELSVFTKDYGTIVKMVMIFKSPKDVAGISYLAWKYDEAADGTIPEDDGWLYMPAMRRVHKIAGSSKTSSFMGTDFTYEDLEKRSLDKDSYTFMGEKEYKDQTCWIVECVPFNKKEKYQKRIVWVNKKNSIILKAEYYNRSDKLERIMTVSDVQKIDGVWSSGIIKMETVSKGTISVIKMSNVEYDIPIEDSYFTVEALENQSIPF